MSGRTIGRAAAERRADLGDRSLIYTLSRHRGQRRIRMWATPEGVRVTAPRGASIASIEEALRLHGDWLERQALAWSPAPAPGDGELVPLGDERLVVRLRQGRVARFRRASGEVDLPAVADAKARLDMLERLYRAEARRRFAASCERYGRSVGAEPSRIRITDARSRWGSCSSRGTISLSWRLVMAPSAVADGICAHEIVHLVSPDHSSTFRRRLATLVPDIEGREAWLATHGRDLLRGPLAAAATPPLAECVPEARPAAASPL